MATLYRRVTTSLKLFHRHLSPVQAVTLGYGTYILFIFIPLCLPLTWRIEHIRLLDSLFMAVSSVSTTGLVTVNTPDAYNFLGQLIILIGLQIGGLGYMTFGSFAIMASKGRVSHFRLKIGKAVFPMPEEFEPVSFIRRAVIFSLIIEALGAVGLYFAFARTGLKSPLWPAIFHSISAFCTAGFSVFPNSLESYRADVWVNLIISFSSILGAIGFIVISDFWLEIRKRTHTITLTSKIILAATFGGIGIGAIILFFDSTISNLPFGERMLSAFFQSMTALTTVGFNTHPIGAISAASIVIVMVLMILGASPSGTGSGLKSTSWSAGLAAIWSSIRGRKEITFFGYTVPYYRIQAAFASFTLYLIAFAFGCFLLLLADNHKFENVVFEVASALGNVGISRGITGELTSLGKMVIIGLMFVGRVGVLSFSLAALSRKAELGNIKKEDDLII